MMTSIKCSVPLASLLLILALGLRGEQTEACGGGDWYGIDSLTTFDPKVAGEPEGLYYNPSDSNYGEGCGPECVNKPMIADWKAYLGEGVVPADWERVLLKATPQELATIQLRLNGKTAAPPKGWEQSSVFKATAAKDKLVAAIGFVQLARKLEAYASFSAYDADGNQRKPTVPPDDLKALATTGTKSKDPFLAQRYAFQMLRLLFYRRDWPATIAFHDQWAKVIGGSVDLGWRARWYLAGALARNGNKARANLELARISAGYAPLAGQAVSEFEPMEDREWRESLKLAKTVREKTELWRLVGIKKDGLVAAQEIVKLDPKSPLVGLLLVRELERAESRAHPAYGGKQDPKELAAQAKAYAGIEQLALGQLAKGPDRPWLLELITGHIAAKKGDLANARARLLRATAGKPNDVRVQSQAKASLAMALAASWKIAPALEEELATNMLGIDKDFGRRTAVSDEVRARLAPQYLQAGRIVDAELLKEGTVATLPLAKGARAKWNDPAFLKDMVARAGKLQTAFDRFVVGTPERKRELERELAMRHILDNDFAAAAKLYQLAKPKSDLLQTDPFVDHIKDCHDCDHEKYIRAKWTHANVATRLPELEAKYKQGGDAGATAAIEIGTVLYNMTYWGNARVMLSSTHQETKDATAAMAWYKKAYDLAKNRELKVKAAFLAAKSELGTAMVNDPNADPLPIPKTWFPIVKQYANTKYYKEVLAECGHFSRWVHRKHP